MESQDHAPKICSALDNFAHCNFKRTDRLNACHEPGGCLSSLKTMGEQKRTAAEVPPFTDEQREYLEALLRPQDVDLSVVVAGPQGRPVACRECGEPIAPGKPCEACAVKRELLRQAFPKLHGDA